MNKEEIKAIEKLKETQDSYLKDELDYAIETVLNLIQKQEKENKELKEKNKELLKYEEYYKDMEEVNKKFISKDKILNFINNELPDEEICECCSNFDVNGVDIKNDLKNF